MNARPPAPSLDGYRDGLHFVARPYPESVRRAIPEGPNPNLRCRQPAGPGRRACGAPAVQQVNKGSHNLWWSYCAEHNHGGWIEDGRVWHWSLEDVTAGVNRDGAVQAIVATGKTPAQAEAFLDLLGSAFRRRGWVEGEPLGDEQIGERLDAFLAVPSGSSAQN